MRVTFPLAVEIADGTYEVVIADVVSEHGALLSPNPTHMIAVFAPIL